MLEVLENGGMRVSRLDTFPIAFTLRGFSFASGDKLVFTVREGNLNYDDLRKGEILFQREITSGTESENGTFISIVASKNEALRIPIGEHLWDLALVSNSQELAITRPALFEVVEVLR